MLKMKVKIYEDKLHRQILELFKEQEREQEEFKASLALLCEQLQQQEKDMYEKIIKYIGEIPNSAIVPDCVLSQSYAKKMSETIQNMLKP